MRKGTYDGDDNGAVQSYVMKVLRRSASGNEGNGEQRGWKKKRMGGCGNVEGGCCEGENGAAREFGGPRAESKF